MPHPVVDDLHLALIFRLDVSHHRVAGDLSAVGQRDRQLEITVMTGGGNAKFHLGVRGCGRAWTNVDHEAERLQ